MRKVLALFFIVTLIISGCGTKDGGLKLEKETPEYELAKSLAEKIEYLDPDKNNILVTSTQFDLTVGDVITDLVAGMGSRADGIKSMTADRLKPYMENITKRFAEQRMLLRNAEAAKIKPTTAEIDSMLNMQFERAGGEKRFLSMIERSGLTVDFVRKDLEKNLKINQYLENALEEKMDITEDELKKIYEQDKTATVRHILFKTQGKTADEVAEIRSKAEKVLAEAKSGKDFSKLANKHSEDPGSNQKGGIYEDFARGTMVKPFDEASFSLPIGEISDLVETRYGYHIIKVENRKHETRPFEEVRQEIEDKLQSERRREMVPDFIEELKKEIELTIVEYE
ncbi:hypothetical protein B6I21_04215 [candidate division KSB1 bacterium 4572_119]|nr:MAG: hypothetical protein B6I21_04215 [candidate division KSB1 bacterium 4572_119]